MAKGNEITEVALVDEIGERILQAAIEAPNVTLAEDDPGKAMLAILGRLSDAGDTAEMNAVFSQDGTTNAESLADSGAHVELRSLTIDRSDYADEQGNQGSYGRFDAVDLDTGAKLIVSCSAWAVNVAFVNADHRGLTPVRGHFVRAAKPTGRGFYPIHFEFDAS